MGVALGWGVCCAGNASAAPATPAVHTVLSGLRNPGGMAFDDHGDLFVADTDHCRVVMVASKDGFLYGRHVQKLRPYVVAGSRCGSPGGLRYPTDVAVNAAGDVFIAEPTVARVVMVRPSGARTLVAIAGTGRPGYRGDGHPAPLSELNEPTGVALDAQGDLFIADTANCRVREVPATSGISFGQVTTPLDIITVAGSGVCGSNGRPGPAGAAQLADPVSLSFDAGGDLFIGDKGDQSVLALARTDQLLVVAGMGSNGPYLQDGLSATGPTAELNDIEGVALSPLGALYVTDGALRAVRVVPAVSGPVLGRSMTAGDMYTLAGALPVSDATGAGNGTTWVVTRMDRPSGIAVSPFGTVFYSDAGAGKVVELG
jgi:hypothetical protein